MCHCLWHARGLCLCPCVITSRGFTSLPPQEAEYAFSRFIPTNKQTNKWQSATGVVIVCSLPTHSEKFGIHHPRKKETSNPFKWLYIEVTGFETVSKMTSFRGATAVHFVCVCVYTCMCVCVRTCIYIYMCMCVGICICMRLYTCVCVWVCIFVHR